MIWTAIPRTLAACLAAVCLAGCGGSSGGGSGTGNAEEGFIAEILSPVGSTTIQQGESVSFACFWAGQQDCDYVWDLDGAAPDHEGTDPFTVTFSTPGTYTVTLNVSKNGDTVYDTVLVTVLDDEDEGDGSATPTTLVAKITSPASDVTIRQGQSVDFQGTVTGGTAPYTCMWSYGGSVWDSHEEDPGMVTFPVTGTYYVTFAVMDAQYRIDYAYVKITVTP
ncbi:MAG TPA: PKD domain-containing protein [Deltaproteobacteria bacterium]|nr:PKD domain-containing protein [Deltaproteobacteria bacterium]